MKKITLLMLLIFITTITLHGQNKLLSSTKENYNGGNWQNSYGTNYEYDSNNNLISETELSWNSFSSVWENTSKTTYIYNENNKATQELYQNWSSTTNTWNNSYKSSYTYTNGRITGIESQNWENSNWKNSYKTVITYKNNLIDTYLSYNWNGLQWVNEERGTLTYNTNNKIISLVSEELISSQWVNGSKSTYSYNTNNKLISNTDFNWDISQNIWSEEEAYRVDYELDGTGNRISRTESGYSDYKEVYTYDNTALMSNFAHPFKDKTGLDYFSEDFPYVNKVLTTTDFYSPNNPGLRTTYNYNNSITLGIEKKELTSNNILVFPNPVQDFLNIETTLNTEIEKVIVTDISGKTILEQNQKTNQVNVQNLSKGIYLLQVLSGDKKWQSKFLKE
jgi:hypothetical protein